MGYPLLYRHWQTQFLFLLDHTPPYKNIGIDSFYFLKFTIEVPKM